MREARPATRSDKTLSGKRRFTSFPIQPRRNSPIQGVFAMKNIRSREWFLAVVVAAALFVGNGSAAAALPATVDSDVYGYVVSPNFRTDFVFAGRLQLKLNANSTTAYSGSFFDYDAQKPYPATVDASNASAPKLTVATRNGTFTIGLDTNFGTSFYSGTATQVPAALASAGPAYFSATAHASTNVVYNVVLTQRVGLFTNPFEIAGLMFIQYDANNRVSGGITYYMDFAGNVYYGHIGTGYFSTSYLYMKAKFGPTTFGVAGTFSGTGWSGNAFSGSGDTQRIWVVSGTP